MNDRAYRHVHTFSKALNKHLIALWYARTEDSPPYDLATVLDQIAAFERGYKQFRQEKSCTTSNQIGT